MASGSGTARNAAYQIIDGDGNLQHVEDLLRETAVSPEGLDKKAAVVSIVGKQNSAKSSLLNALVSHYMMMAGNGSDKVQWQNVLSASPCLRYNDL